MSRRGVPAYIEVYADYVDGLLKIEGNSHIMVIGWLHRADRDLLQVDRYSIDGQVTKKGVFACRAPVRPNPIGVTTARLLRIEGARLYVDELDMIDGTPVLDIKPHAPGFDAIFAARSVRDLFWTPYRDPGRVQESMLDEAENFHGERCSGVALGVRMMFQAMRTFEVAQKNPGLRLVLGLDGCVADALQALSGATFGNGRLVVGAEPVFRFRHGRRELTFGLRDHGAGSPDEVMSRDIDQLFDIAERRLAVESNKR
jgi:tRNA-Thr(GGU) m(6)t(6)A37 methyltransferase TsaA